MIIVILFIFLTADPAPTFGYVGTFKTMDECKKYVADSPEKVKPRLMCLSVLSADLKEA